MPECPGLVVFVVVVVVFDRGDTEGSNSSGILCSMFVCVLFCVNLCRDWICGFGMICVHAE